MSIRLAWRSIWRNRRRTVITVLSMAIGITIAIFFIAMGDGVYCQLVNDAARMQAGHVTVEHPEYRAAPAVDLYVDHADELRVILEKLDGVELAKKLVIGQAVIRSGRDSIGVAVLGVEPSVEIKTSPLPKHVNKGEYLADGDEALVIIGSKLARQLQVDVGSKVVVTTNNVAGDLVEELFHVKGVYETGTDEIDGYMVQAPLRSIAALFGLPEHAVTQLGVVLSEPERQDAIYKAASVVATRRDAAVRRWQDIMPDLASYIKIDKGSNIVFQAVLIIIILFTLFNTILMSVMERKREFNVLMALGTPRGLLRGQVVAESVLLGLLGCGLGVLMGWAVSYYYQVTGLDFSKFMKEGMDVSGFAISAIVRPRPTLEILLWPSTIVFAASVLMSFIAILRVRDDDIAETLRHG